MSNHLVKLLSFNAGYVDTASFLALHGLFAAHVTGNFVTLGAALVSDSKTGAWTKLFALPMFCLMVLVTKLLVQKFIRLQRNAYSSLILLMFIFFCITAALSILYLPFPNVDTFISFLVGMLLVAAMAIQNAMHRIFWIKETPSTVMTGSTTQFMLDIGELFSKQSIDKKTIIYERLYSILPALLSFGLGCAIAAIIYKLALIWLFVMPPILVIFIYINRDNYKKT